MKSTLLQSSPTYPHPPAPSPKGEGEECRAPLSFRRGAGGEDAPRSPLTGIYPPPPPTENQLITLLSPFSVAVFGISIDLFRPFQEVSQFPVAVYEYAIDLSQISVDVYVCSVDVCNFSIDFSQNAPPVNKYSLNKSFFINPLLQKGA
jgi:hypothetical protein